MAEWSVTIQWDDGAVFDMDFPSYEDAVACVTFPERDDETGATVVDVHLERVEVA
jgi:hypothetical protein